MSSISFTDLHNTNPGKDSLWNHIVFTGQLRMWWMALHCWKIPSNAFNPNPSLYVTPTYPHYNNYLKFFGDGPGNSYWSFIIYGVRVSSVFLYICIFLIWIYSLHFSSTASKGINILARPCHLTIGSVTYMLQHNIQSHPSGKTTIKSQLYKSNISYLCNEFGYVKNDMSCGILFADSHTSNIWQ